MSIQMNPLLAQFYATEETIKTASDNSAAQASEEENALNAAILDDLIKIAEAEGVDLNAFSEDELVELVNTHKDDLVKQASAEQGLGEEVDPAIVEADYLGRVMAHSYTQELAAISEAARQHEKLASFSDEDLFEELAFARAENLLAAMNGEFDNFVKEASLEIDAGMEDLDDAITLRAAELLEAAGWDVDAIASALDD